LRGIIAAIGKQSPHNQSKCLIARPCHAPEKQTGDVRDGHLDDLEVVRITSLTFH
jgi:hypothetical protein